MTARLGYEAILARLDSLRRPEALAGMARYGISVRDAYGVSMPTLRQLAREIGHDHELALRLWQHGVRETMLLATLVDEPRVVTEAQVESMVLALRDWELCDQCCINLFRRLPLAYGKALEWSARPEEFIKRAGFVLMARQAHQDSRLADAAYEPFLAAATREACDGRTYVKKAVNWALRDIGKRNEALCGRAVTVAGAIATLDCPTARWIAADALRELKSDAVRDRLRPRRQHQLKTLEA